MNINGKFNKVIVSGVTGQDGSFMADFLLPQGYEVYGMVRRTAKPDLSNLKNALKNPNFKLIEGDLADGASLREIVKKVVPDYFINFAAQSFVAAAWKMPEYTFDVDAIGVIRCLEAIRCHSPKCRFYNAGSSEEFGDVVTVPQNESHPARARSVYGAAKIAARQIVKVYRESYGLYAIQGALFNHESERRGEEFVTRKISLGVAKITQAIRNNSPVPAIVLGNLDVKRDWSHAQDFVEGVWRMLNQDKFNNSLPTFKGNGLIIGAQEEHLIRNLKEYVLSSDETHSIREFIELAFEFADIQIKNTNINNLEPCIQYTKNEGLFIPHNKEEQINYTLVNGVPAVVVSRDFYRPAEVVLLHGDSSAARRELLWKPQISFKELVKRMVDNDIRNLTN